MLKKEVIRFGGAELTLRVTDVVPKNRIYIMSSLDNIVDITDFEKMIEEHPERFAVIDLGKEK